MQHIVVEVAVLAILWVIVYYLLPIPAQIKTVISWIIGIVVLALVVIYALQFLGAHG